MPNYTQQEIEKMNVSTLRDLAAEHDVEVDADDKKAQLQEKLLAALAEGDAPQADGETENPTTDDENETEGESEPAEADEDDEQPQGDDPADTPAADEDPKLAGIADVLCKGGEVSGYTFVPAKKAPDNHTVTMTTLTRKVAGVPMVLCEMQAD